MTWRRSILIAALTAACAAPGASHRARSTAHPADGDAAVLPRVEPATAASAAPPAATTGAAPAAPHAPVPVLPFEEAVAAAADELLSGARLPDAAGSAPFALVIDPLIDGVTAEQSNATRSMGELIGDVVRTRYPSFALEPFTRETVARSPLVLIGTFTPVRRERDGAAGADVYRICLALIDLRSGRVVGKGWARADAAGVDTAPLAFYRDDPTWSRDATVEGYVRTCQATKLGERVDAVYLDHVLVGALVAEATDAYDAGRYGDALDGYAEARRITRGGDELRVLNGLYLSNYKLGRLDAALEEFGRIVEYGLARKRLAVKFLFHPGTTAFWRDPAISGVYPAWLRSIAERSAAADRCLEISGHTSPTGPAALNERLSQLRAEVVRDRLTAVSPALATRTIAIGKGSRENLVGTGRDDASDALDRRVAFEVVDCGRKPLERREPVPPEAVRQASAEGAWDGGGGSSW